MTIAYVGKYKSWKIARTDADIASTATGKEFLKVPVPKPYNAFVRVTGDADGDFILAAQHLTRGHGTTRSPVTRFYRVQTFGVGPGASYQIQAFGPALPAGAFGPEDGIALSADGSQFAYTEGSPARGLPQVTVFSFTRNRTTTWRLPAKMIDAVPAFSGAPSWQADDRHLAVDTSSGNSRRTRCLDCIRLLDTATKGGTFLADSKRLVAAPNLHVQVDWNSAFVSPDGSHVLRSAEVSVPVSKNADYIRPWIYDYSATTGRLLKTMTGPRSTDWALLWTNPNGQSFIRSSVKDGAGNGFIRAAIFAEGHWRPFHLPPQTRTAAW